MSALLKQSAAWKQVVVMLLGGLCAATAVQTEAAASAAATRGAYLARIGDCSSCHTDGPGAPDYAGGAQIRSPFGVIYASNITPDRATGIGNYSFEDFKQALREGRTPSGKHLYPAMPYASFAAASDADLRDLYTFFMEDVKPVSYHPPETKLPFPFNQRWGLIFWNAVFARHTIYRPKPDRDARWNRGAYLVQSFGHCGACHTLRGVAYQERGFDETSPHFLSGAMLDRWYAGDLREDDATGLRRWSADDIARFLGTGHSDNKMVFGNMTEVVENSGQYMTDADRLAIASYLKSIPAGGEESHFHPDRIATASIASAAPLGEHPGAGLYQNFCADCHGSSGEGKSDQAPALAGNPMVLSNNSVSVIRVILEGGPTAKTQAKRVVMPHFAHRLSDAEIADVLNYLRHSWGNQALAVPATAVTALRKDLKE